ncbi:MAG: AAA family ATPase [Haliangiales bacterium]
MWTDLWGDPYHKPQRGGFAKLRTQGTDEPIEFRLYYRQRHNARPITYQFKIADANGIPIVIEERLRQRRKGQKHGGPYSFLRLKDGVGQVWAGEETENTEGATEHPIELDDLTQLGITTLGQLKEHPRIVALRAYIESWYLSYFVPDAARRLPSSGVQRHLNRTGDNLGNVVQYLQRSHPARFDKILQRISGKIPGIQTIDYEVSADNRLLLRFNEQGYQDPFFQRSMSDGTLKMFAYLVLLEDPAPRPFIGIEEPENGLYHKLLEELAREFRHYAEASRGKTQIMLSTHSPYFVDALEPEQVFLMEKDERGHTQVTRTADMPIIRELKQQGIPLGSLWYSNHLEERFNSGQPLAVVSSAVYWPAQAHR